MDAADVHVVCGPTASGKSALAAAIAAQIPVTIISADSRQIYRDFDIGTAKPTGDERRAIPHEGVDIVDPNERFSAAAWADQADHWIVRARAEGRVPLVVGGTGLYLRALFDGLFEEPPLDTARRAALDAELAEMATADLRRWVERLDPPRALLGRTQLIRSVEIALLSGRQMSALHAEQARVPRWRARYLVVDPGALLVERIAARIDDMLEHGWRDEVQRLMQTVPEGAPAWNAAGYDAMRQLVRGETTVAAAREQILIRTRQYAKRQRTWFRHQLPPDAVTRIDPLARGCDAVVERWLSARAAAGTEP